MNTQLANKSYIDPKPDRISSEEWHSLFRNIPSEFPDHYRYFRHLGKNEWNSYLFPPSTHVIYGSRYLRKLKFDNSLASLRLWGFMLNESERLFRAKQSGMNIVAAMGDLGAIPPLIFSFKDTIPFYPDCYWWTPFLNESTVLFDEANRLGIGEDCCFVRAALGAFSKLAYFPEPELGIAATGASCDDMGSVMQAIERLGHKLHWFELPHRKDKSACYSTLDFETTNSNHIEYQSYLKEFLVKEFRSLISELERTTGQKFDPDSLKQTLSRVNTLRSLVSDIKHLTFSAEISPLPALEIMNIEFITLSAYSDLDEAIDVLKHIKTTVIERIRDNSGTADKDAVRIVWVTPPADPLLLNYLEDLGGRLTGTEFVINQALHPFEMEDDPLLSLADGLLNASLIGTSKTRAKGIIQQVKDYNAEGVIISNIFASSHCAYETYLIKEYLRKEIDIPLLSFDVVAPGKKMQQSQILNRMAAFIEIIKEKRRM